MNLAVITLSAEGAALAELLVEQLPSCSAYLHEGVPGPWPFQRFPSVVALTAELFGQVSGVVFIGPCGVAVRSIAPHLRHKTTDPAVVVVDVGARWAVSLLSGHEGGANELAVTVGNILGAEPIISTTTEALKTLIVGVGCRRGTTAEQIVSAIRSALAESDLSLDRVRLLSSADIKSDEQGLLDAARELGIPLRFVSSHELRNCPFVFQHSEFVEQKVNVPAVAEPAALLAGRRTTLLVGKRVYNGVTVAVAEERCLWSA
jgi:cobalt-precorrin 5A hydrolase